jgi:hypothetical protein
MCHARVPRQFLWQQLPVFWVFLVQCWLYRVLNNKLAGEKGTLTRTDKGTAKSNQSASFDGYICRGISEFDPILLKKTINMRNMMKKKSSRTCFCRT